MFVRRFAGPGLGLTSIPIVTLLLKRMFDFASDAHDTPGILIYLKEKKISNKYTCTTSRCMQCAVLYMCQPALSTDIILSYFWYLDEPAQICTLCSLCHT